MTELRALVITRGPSDLPVDHITNTLYFDTDSPFTWIDEAIEGVNETELAVDLRNIFRARNFHNTGHGVEVKMYDMSDAEPRRVRGHANWAVGNGNQDGAGGPREVACCLSFRGEANNARSRGRIYVGPYPSAQMGQRPSAGVRDNLMTLATAIGNLGGVNIDWCVRSVTGNTMSPVKFAWADDEWDTVRSRGLKATTRSTATLNE